MPCHVVKLPEGGSAFFCTTGPRQRCACGQPSTRLCDWKVKTRRSGTCDRPLCARCTHVPAPDKDLCPQHAAEWKARGAAAQRPGEVP